MALDGVMGDIIIPFGIHKQSRFGYDPTNGIRHHADMDILRGNIEHLRGARSINEVGIQSGAGQSWLQRFMNPTKPSGIHKPNVEKITLVARYFGVPYGDLISKDLTGTRPAGSSQPTGQEQEIVHAAVTLLHYFDDLAAEPPPRETYAARLFIAMQVVQEEGVEGIQDGSRMVSASRTLAARLRAAG